MAYTLSTDQAGSVPIDLGEVQNERVLADSGTTYLRSATGDSSEIESVKILSSQKTIEINCKYVGTLNEIRTFIGYINTWTDYEDATKYYFQYHSDLLNATYNVIVATGSFEWVAGSPSVLIYSLRLVRTSI